MGSKHHSWSVEKGMEGWRDGGMEGWRDGEIDTQKIILLDTKGKWCDIIPSPPSPR